MTEKRKRPQAGRWYPLLVAAEEVLEAYDRGDGINRLMSDLRVSVKNARTTYPSKESRSVKRK